MNGLVYLVASGQDGLLPKIAKRAYEALGKAKARVAVTYAPVAGDADMLAFMSERTPRLFPDAQIETIDDDPAVVERADLVFVSGGDPTLGARVLDQTGAAAWLRDARTRGTPLMGVSAGTIVLGEWWAAWPEEEGDDDPELARTSLVRCAGVVPGHVFDTHNEEDDWDELRIVATLAERGGEPARFVGIPTGGALIVGADGSLETVGAPPFYLR